MSGKLLDTYPSGATIYALFDSFNGSGASVTLTGLAVTDVEIYKNGSTTQRASDAGIALLDTDGIDFDAITGIHGISIDLADNTDAGFYAVGSQYTVVISAVTIDSQTVSFILGSFRIMAAEGVVGYDNVTLGNVAQGGAAMAVTALSIAVTNSAGSALTLTSSGGNGHGAVLQGNGTGEGLKATGGATGIGIEAIGGATSGAGAQFVGGGQGPGLSLSGTVNNAGLIAQADSGAPGISATGAGANAGMRLEAGGTGHGLEIIGGSTSGDGINCSVTSGAEISADITGTYTGNLATNQATIIGFLDTEIAAILAAVDAEVATIVSGVADVQARLPAALVSGRIDASVGAMAANVMTAAAAAADLTTELQSGIAASVKAINLTELAAVPAATPTLGEGLAFMYMALRNRRTTTATADTIQNDAGATIATAVLSDDATTFTKGEYA